MLETRCCSERFLFKCCSFKPTCPSLTEGLTESQAQSRLRTNGLNYIQSYNKHFLLYRGLWSFFGGFAPILWLAAILSVIAETAQRTPTRTKYNIAVACSLFAVLIINGTIQAWQVCQCVLFLLLFTYLALNNHRNFGQLAFWNQRRN